MAQGAGVGPLGAAAAAVGRQEVPPAARRVQERLRARVRPGGATVVGGGVLLLVVGPAVLLQLVPVPNA